VHTVLFDVRKIVLRCVVVFLSEYIVLISTGVIALVSAIHLRFSFAKPDHGITFLAVHLVGHHDVDRDYHYHVG
jgi:hypothetical protein